MSGTHATLSASAAHRWIPCPGSIRLAEELPRGIAERTSRAACEGTAAHSLAEWCLRNKQGPEDYPDSQILVPEWPHEAFPVAGDMAEAVQVYLDFVAEELARLGPTAQMQVEVTGQPIPGRLDMWGTADLVLIEAFGELVVADYKHGKGVIVEPQYNPQAMFYGLSALRVIGGAEDVSRVKLVIVQPRAYHGEGGIRHWYTTPKELMEFGSQLAAAGDRTKDADAPLVAGDHCKFCPAKGACPAQRSESLALLDISPTMPESTNPPPVPHDPAEIERLLKIIPRWDDFVKSVHGVSMRLAQAGHKFADYKLVQKSANRKWVSDNVDVMLAKEVPQQELFEEPKLKSPAQVEKVLTKHKIKPAQRREIMAPLVERPAGGLALVPRDDPRDEHHVVPDSELLGAGEEDWLA